MSRLMAIPTFFSLLVWMISLFHANLHEYFQPDLPRVAWLLGSTTSDKNTMMSLVPRNVADSFQLGRISAQLEAADKHREEQDAVRRLLDEARVILQSPVPLTFEEATNGVAEAAKYKVTQGSPLRKVLGMLSFVRILCFIALMGMVATLFPALQLAWKIIPQQVKDALLYVWSVFVSMAKSCRPLVEPTLYLVPIVCFETALLFPEGGDARGQVAALAALFSFAPYYYSVKTHPGSLDQLGTHRKYKTTSICLWAASVLAPMAWASSSKFLGFFTMGAVFGTLGFVAVPFPFGWAAGFFDEASMNRSVFASVIIIVTFLGFRALGVASNALSTFETGAAVFGMLAFGIAGLIKSAKADGDDWDFGGILRAEFLLYPVSWLTLGYFGSVWSYPSLTNTSTTFVVLWFFQFYWRIVGFNAVGVFVASTIIYAATLWLQTRPDFVASLFKL